MKSLTMQISDDGTIRCLHTEYLPLEDIGRMRIERASAVEFNEQTQLWEVRLAGSRRVDYTHPSRAACIEWEVNTINARLANE